MQEPNNDEIYLLETALMAARQAGDIEKARFGPLHRFETNPDMSVVTEVDVEVEKIIKQIIRMRHPNHGFLGEETGREVSSSLFRWVVDPIDGTKNFLRGVPLFAIEIALLHDGIPFLGVSNLPAMEDLLWAVRGKGAFSPSGPVAVSKVESLEAAYVSFGNIKHFANRRFTQHLIRLTRQAFQSRGIGDAWSFHLLAQGKIDVFVDADTELWDIAAFATIIHEAGGIMTDFEGQPISELSTSVIAANKALHPVVLRYFRSST
jgi:histidinol-phosphatase